MNIIQLVPHLPPIASGIGDYSLTIAQKLLSEHDIFTYFITYELWFAKYVKEHPYLEQFPVKRIKEKRTEHFLTLLPDDFEAIVLHYNFVEQQETAFWLLHNLRVARKQHPFKLTVMFHELTTQFKRKGLYLPAPKHIVSCLSTAGMANHILTNNFVAQNYLSKWLNRSVICIPNFSTIGEPAQVPPLSERNRTMIVFGSKSRRTVYQKFYPQLLECCHALGIEKICDIGPPCGVALADFQEIPLVEMGVQPPEVIGELMLSSLAGFVDYSHAAGKIGKSTIFAAYCSHGLLPISSDDIQSEGDGLKVNTNYLIPSKQLTQLTSDQLQEIANNSHQWYIQHDLGKLVQTFASCLL
ncbi:hypothetical protein [Nostoc sp. MS1]|uniref:hypothetical protein n=1 Tax=Nostoc sp. MS1 TaxID=2764711 RepID=UPI001CC7F765|nr:hypothetical protein [Nostoc sp. MS1]BCL33626.1 hypothetical protein NSMS1_00730 [Nostoc sp. MS1]